MYLRRGEFFDLHYGQYVEHTSEITAIDNVLYDYNIDAASLGVLRINDMHECVNADATKNSLQEAASQLDVNILNARGEAKFYTDFFRGFIEQQEELKAIFLHQQNSTYGDSPIIECVTHGNISIYVPAELPTNAEQNDDNEDDMAKYEEDDEENDEAAYEGGYDEDDEPGGTKQEEARQMHQVFRRSILAIVPLYLAWFHLPKVQLDECDRCIELDDSTDNSKDDDYKESG